MLCLGRQQIDAGHLEEHGIDLIGPLDADLRTLLRFEALDRTEQQGDSHGIYAARAAEVEDHNSLRYSFDQIIKVALGVAVDIAMKMNRIARASFFDLNL